MKKFALMLTTIIVISGWIGTTGASGHHPKTNCPQLVQSVEKNRKVAQHYQNLYLLKQRSNHAEQKTHSCAFVGWLNKYWHKKANESRKIVLKAQKNPFYAIKLIFGRVGQYDEAITVSRCETGNTFYTGTVTGQYQGLFQMGSWERATYGHGPDALSQTVAAFKYFLASGSDWSPWQCLPYGGLRW